MSYLAVYSTPTEDLATLIADDPVRPDIELCQRVNHNSRVYVLRNDDRAEAVTCVKFLDSVPASVDDLTGPVTAATTAVFYTIWSYVPGSGRVLIDQVRTAIQVHQPTITTFVTLSPKTEMARRFHLRNGAEVYRENSDTINYIYK